MSGNITNMIKAHKRKQPLPDEHLIVQKTYGLLGVQAMSLSYSEANQLQAQLRRELLAAGVTVMDAV